MKKLSKEDKAGLYITVIVHVSVVIILLVASLGFSLKNESSFILDFTKIEEIERLQKELAFKEQVSHRLDEIISEAGGIPTRNIAVDRGALKDDRGTNAEELYKDAERIQKELNESLRRKVENSGDYVEQNDSREPEKKEKSYSGPSVLSWELSGRKAVKLPIPAYRCMGAGGAGAHRSGSQRDGAERKHRRSLVLERRMPQELCRKGRKALEVQHQRVRPFTPERQHRLQVHCPISSWALRNT